MSAAMNLWDAASTGDVDALHELLSPTGGCEGEIDLTDWLARTPLILAAANNRPEAVAVLLDKGAEPSVQDRESGWAALHHACDR